MFDWLRKLILKEEPIKEIPHELKQVKIDPDTHQFALESVLVGKHLKKEQIALLSSVNDYYSKMIIDFEEKKYVVGVTRSSTTRWYDYEYYCHLHITEVKKVPRNRIVYLKDLNDISKCKFMLEKLSEVEASLDDISHSLNKKDEEIKSRNECREKCLLALEEKIKT